MDVMPTEPSTFTHMITSYDYISREWEIVYYNQDNMVPRFLCCFLLLLQIYWMYLYIFLHDVEKLLYNNIMVNIEITIRNVCFVCVYLQIFKAFLILKSRQKKLICSWFLKWVKEMCTTSTFQVQITV